MVFRQLVLSITITTIISNFSVFFLSLNLISSVKVWGNSDRLPESIKDKNNKIVHYMRRLGMR